MSAGWEVCLSPERVGQSRRVSSRYERQERVKKLQFTQQRP